MTVADIGARVGYSSTGSFTRRFTELVGLSPTGYRALSLTPSGPEQAPPVPELTPAASARHGHTGSGPARLSTGTVTGLLLTTGESARAVRVGVFASPLLQGAPVRLAHASAPGPFTLEHIPAGVWYVHAVTRPRPTDPADTTADGASPVRLTAATGPVRVKDNTARRLEITLSAPDWSRPPVLSALMDLAPHPAAA